MFRYPKQEVLHAAILQDFALKTEELNTFHFMLFSPKTK